MFRSAILALTLMLPCSSAIAMMESNPHELPLADAATVAQITNVPGGRERVGSSKQVFAEHWTLRKAAVLIARVEGATCNGEFCPTAFISELGREPITSAPSNAASGVIGAPWPEFERRTRKIEILSRRVAVAVSLNHGDAALSQEDDEAHSMLDTDHIPLSSAERRRLD